MNIICIKSRKLNYTNKTKENNVITCIEDLKNKNEQNSRE